MSKEFWRWTESRWTAPDRDWRDGKIVTAGVDVGSVSSQPVILVDGQLNHYSNMRTGSDSPNSATNATNWAMEGTGLTLDKIHYTVGTGYGRVNVPFAQRAITEIACHARGANFMYGSTVRTVLDMGGQDCKAIRCDDKGKVVNFLMNDKCAAGTGRGMEVFADLLGVSINDVGELSLKVVEEPPPVSSTCVVFAKSEASGLLRQGWSKEKVLAAMRAGIRTIILPQKNEKDLEEIPKYIKKDMEFVFAETMDDVLGAALKKGNDKKPKKSVKSQRLSVKKRK